MNIFYHKVLRINMIYFWKEILKTWKGFLAPTVLAVFIMYYVEFKNLKIFLASAFVFIIVYCASIMIFSCNEEEKNLVLGIIRRKRR